jgi:addiction module RelE/StbE family toxin
MIKTLYGDRFLRSARKLPRVQQTKLAKLLELLQDTPFHPKLHTKPLSGELSGLYSFRITRDWRVIFQFRSPDEIVLVNAGHRKEIYQ